MNKLKKIIFITKGGTKIGLGHLMRCVAIAEHARDTGTKPFFIVNNDKSILKILNKYKFSFIKVNDILNLNTDNITNQKVIIDTKKDVSDLINKLHDNDCKIMLLDNTTNACYLADIILFPVEHFNSKAIDISKIKGKLYCGAKYFPLRKEIIGIENRRKTDKNKPTVLISFGGADPNELTTKVLKAIKNLKLDKKVVFRIVVGPAFSNHNKQEITRLSKQSKNKIQLAESGTNLQNIYENVVLYITALGVSVYELNYLKTPIILMYNYRNELREAEKLKNLHIVEWSGYYKNIEGYEIKGIVRKLLNKDIMNIRKYVDEMGVKRILSLIKK
jgi:spore coat polysaccharide biosynthesis predicted glycosyltransferase SpsG